MFHLLEGLSRTTMKRGPVPVHLCLVPVHLCLIPVPVSLNLIGRLGFL